MKVFLLNPLGKGGIHYHRDFCGSESAVKVVYPPMDLAYTSSILKSEGHEVELLDASALNISDKEVIGKVEKFGPDALIFSCITPTFFDDVNLVKKIKDKFDVKTIVSGPHVTVYPEHSLENSNFDFVVIGEPEITFKELINNIERPEKVSGVGFVADGKIVLTRERDLLDINSLPFPDRSALPNSKYWSPQAKKMPLTTIFTSRGCPYQCTFCNSPVWYKRKWRARKAESVVEELEEIKRLGIKEVFFRDETLTINKDRMVQICEAMENLNLSWYCFSRVDTIDQEMLRIMKKAGCHQVSYGVESGNQKVLDENNKGITIEQVRSAVKWTKDAGIEVAGSFMLGLLGESKESVMQTINFALELNPDIAQFSIATPFPRTPFHETVTKNKWLKNEDWSKFRIYQDSVVDYPNLSAEELNNFLSLAYRKFYFRPSYAVKRLARMRGLKELQHNVRAGGQILKTWGLR